MNAESILEEHIDIIDREIKKVFESRDFPRELYDMMKYHLGWVDENLEPVERYKGKRFRPTMCLLAYHSLAGVYNKALPAAASIELIHNFSLIHDDIEDRDETRRGKPTVWKHFGVEHAINAGDGMHVLANLAALRLQEVDVADAKIIDVLKILSNTVMKLCEGQYLDMGFENKMDVDIDLYLNMVYRKTAALIEASFWIGAMLATDNKVKIRHFRSFGRNIGIAFQIVDDIIGIWSSKTGKPRASDIRNKKKTLPVIYAISKASREDRAFIQKIYSKKELLSDKEVEKVLALLEKVKAREFSIETARKYEISALQEFDSLGIKNPSLEKIISLSKFLITRSY
ncbi:(2E,6E)-farnesyl diphosphate synthase [archaeon]|nr:(2E,6E)-farnesyl diphosphate synthase [archaeon]